MRRLFLALFLAIPILSTVFFVIAAFYFGDTGFKIDKTQNHFLVSKVKAPVNAVESKDQIISIHGLSYSEFLGFAISDQKQKTPGSMQVLRDTRKIDMQMQTVPYNTFSLLERIWPHLILIIVFLTLGSIALSRAPPSPQVRLFFLMLCAFSTSMAMTIPSSLAILSPYVYSPSFMTHAVFNWVSFGLWLHFALRFPESRDILKHRRWVPICIYILPAITTIGGSLYLSEFSSEFWSHVQKLRNLYIPLIILAVFIKHALDYKKISFHQEKNQIKFPLIAYWLTFSPYLFFHLLPNLLFDQPLIPFQIAIFGFFVLPVAYFIGVLRYRLFNIDRIISRTIAYFIIIFALLIIYSLFLVGIKKLFFGDQVLAKELFFAFLILVNILFHPLILKLDHLIRKLFLRHESISPKTMHKFSNKISATLQFPDLVHTITTALPEAVNIKSMAIMTLENEQSRIYPEHLGLDSSYWPKSRLVQQFNDKSVSYLSPYQTFIDNQLKKEIMQIHKAGFSLIIPLNGPQSLSALFFVGHKKSGKFFNEQDIHLLASFANQAAIALENATYYNNMLESKNQLEKMFDQKVHSEKMAAIGEMTSVLTHELKNPLGIIHSSAQYLLEGRQSNIVAREMLYYIKNEVEHINQSINSILKLARQKKPQFEKIDLSLQIPKLIDQWKISAAHRTNVDIKIIIPRSLPFIYADYRQIRQVLLNLLQNSEEMLENGGLITIELQEDNEFIQIQITDNGPGIPDENLDKVFKKFFTTKKQGIGLGLAVCKQIISAHNGSISIKNQNQCGTLTKIRLPQKPLPTFDHQCLKEEANEI